MCIRDSCNGLHCHSRNSQDDFLQEGETMTDRRDRQQRSILRSIAHRAMLARGLLPEFSPEARAQLDGIHEPATRAEESTRDLRHLIWCSIDNDDSRDLDQLTVAEATPGGDPSRRVSLHQSIIIA